MQEVRLNSPRTRNTNLAFSLVAAGVALTLPHTAHAVDPLKIGVIAEAASISGAAIPNAAQMAADEINAKGGVDGRPIQIITYDDHSSSTDAVRAFQRAVSDDKVNAVIASYVSEIVLALEPWAARLHMPMVTPGAASNEISQVIKKDYARNKYTFHGYLTSAFLADSVCESAAQVLVRDLHMKSAVVMSEDAAWTTPLDAGYLDCLPKIGLTVVDHIRFSPDTTDFTPLFNKIESEKPDVIVTGIAHVGVQPTVQWQSQQVPVPMFGISAQATSSTFWKDTNGAAEGVLIESVSAPGAAITPTAISFTDNYTKRYGITPAYDGNTAYDEVYYIADAIKRAGSTDPDKLVAALEQTDYVGTIGRVQFYGKDDAFPHAMKQGADFVSGLVVQWQDGKQVTVWPPDIATGKLKFPGFVRLQQASN
jgi:branched-chain amino acid transport system substrate-binding protein